MLDALELLNLYLINSLYICGVIIVIQFVYVIFVYTIASLRLYEIILLSLRKTSCLWAITQRASIAYMKIKCNLKIKKTLTENSRPLSFSCSICFGLGKNFGVADWTAGFDAAAADSS